MRILIFCLIVFPSQLVFAQQAKFVARKNGNDIFVEHKVQPKENWYSVGRMYLISPKEIAQFNGLTMSKGLGIGQSLRVPLVSNNFSQASDAGINGTPVYHEVQSKENLFRVASIYGAAANDIRRWNGLKSDQVNAGMMLIIGYVKAMVPTPDETVVAVVQAEQPKQQAPVKQEAVKMPAVVQAGVKPVADIQPKETTVGPVIPAGSGQFASLFQQQAREGKQQILENPVYGMFKSSSGWQDGKYYVLLNNVVPGTIVKISSKTTGKQLFAKVLGAVPAGKESEGMVMRMSNATQAALGMSEGVQGNVDLAWFN